KNVAVKKALPTFPFSVGANPCVRPAVCACQAAASEENNGFLSRAHTRVRPYIIKAAIAMCFSAFARSMTLNSPRNSALLLYLKIK
ncbi:MAG: hypothetical protein IIY79_05415, partial [Ruminococcus sp.]|nr:hypothetical protein [Ruminococcus sp.]